MPFECYGSRGLDSTRIHEEIYDAQGYFHSYEEFTRRVNGVLP